MKRNTRSRIIQKEIAWNREEDGKHLGSHDLCEADLAVSRGGTTPGPECESEEEIHRLYSSLTQGGGTLMPLNNHGFSRQFGWVNDRYGVSWQLNLR